MDAIAKLNGVFSNAKTRGTWGEVQLKSILTNVLAEDEYDENKSVKQGSNERVEFVVKIPDKGTANGTRYLPIDAKFPNDIAPSELKRRITNEAERIKKYINPPITTDFAIMFLPTESLYAQALTILGLTDTCQKNHIIIAGPMTITAILNAFRMVFLNFNLSKQTTEIMNLFEEVQKSYNDLDEAINNMLNSVEKTRANAETIQRRTNNIRNKISKIVGVNQN